MMPLQMLREQVMLYWHVLQFAQIFNRLLLIDPIEAKAVSLE